MFNNIKYSTLGFSVIAIIFIFLSGFIIFDAVRDYEIKCKLESVLPMLDQVEQKTEALNNEISYLKSDKKELYKALASCNFLRETENLPIGEINKDLVKALSSYYNAESLVTKALEKYKEE